MGHDIHFLRRLQRASSAETELALSLYRDPKLVSFILHRARLPEDAERIALSLHAEDRGPYVIVTREGTFVTCLGRDMKCDLPLIGHERLQAITGTWDGYKERITLAKELTGDPTLGGVFTTLSRKGRRISREDFLAASAVQPIVRPQLLGTAVELFDGMIDARREILRIKRARKRDEELLRTYWRSVHYMSALLPMFAMGGPSGVEHLVEIATRHQVATLSWMLVRQDDVALACRGIWTTGQLGRKQLPQIKKRHRTAGTELSWVDTMTSLLVLGARHSKLRGEIDKMIAKTDRWSTRVLDYLSRLPEGWSNVCAVTLRDPDRMLEISSQDSRERFVALSRRFELAPPYDYDSPDDVDETLAFALDANIPVGFVGKPQQLMMVLFVLPWLARANAEDLFLPRDLIDALPQDLFDEDAMGLVHRLKGYEKRTPVQREQPKIGRNAPCPCGSGKKYKRCCLDKDQADTNAE